MRAYRSQVNAVISFFCLVLLWFSSSGASADLLISPPKAPLPLIEEAFPGATRIAEKAGEPPAWTIYKGAKILGYAFETNDIAPIPAYSGEPVNMLVILDPQGVILSAKVLEHHEPILLVGIPEEKLDLFADQYSGINVANRVKIGGQNTEGVIPIDGLSGATVTVMVVNLAVMRAATEVARAKGILAADARSAQPLATVDPAVFVPADWQQLTGDGSIRRLLLRHEEVEEAFTGTGATGENQVGDDPFIDLYYTQLDIPSIGRNLLGDSEYQWLMEQLQPGEHALGLMANGYSFKGSGYVRGAIFDRFQIQQRDYEFSFRDIDHYRINDLFAVGVPAFKEMSIFIVRDQHHFDPGSPWSVNLLVRRQTGPVDSVFTSFKADYEPVEQYLIRPKSTEIADEDLPLWQRVWRERSVETYVVVFSIVLLTVLIFLQNWLARYPRFIHHFRRFFLLYTVFFVGWYSLGQLSVVNVLTFVQALMTQFNWETFLLDPVIFVLWVFVAVTVLLWGRGVYCGWLCPFGALQELVSRLAVRLKIPQIVIPHAIHEILWAVKYLILLVLFGISLGSLQMAERYAEVEPFKTTFLLHFDRSWPFILYAVVLLLLSLFSRKVYCRYICPLGAALAIPSGVRLFDWFKRRRECGQPCQICARDCEIGAIDPSGQINMRECHYCLDCQMTYHDDAKCPYYHKKNVRRHRADDSVETVAIRPLEVMGNTQ